MVYDCRRALRVVAKGFDQYGEPVTIEGPSCWPERSSTRPALDGVLFIDRLDAEARKLAMKQIRESEWFGLEARWSGCRHPPAGWGSEPIDAGRLRRHSRGGAPVAGRRGRVAPRPGGSGHRPDAPAGRGRRLVASPVAQRSRAGRAVHAGAPARSGTSRRPYAAWRPDCVAVVAYGALVPGPRWTSPARLGEPALLLPAGLARRRAGAARDLGR
ncbi:MAG: hypothetical protein R2734_00645 [Nocardioides sp.]